MTPEFASRMRKVLPRGILAILLIVLAAMCWKIAYGGGIHIPPLVEVIENIMAEEPAPLPPEPVDEWLYVQADNVLLWPVVKGKCTIRSALAQVHAGEKVLVVVRHGAWVEVALNNQSREHSHGCIHETLLGKDNGKG